MQNEKFQFILDLLMYPTQFSPDLLDESDRVVKQFLIPEIKTGSLTVAEIVNTLEAASHETGWYKDSVPTNHSQEQTLDFFKKIVSTLQQSDDL
jgi:hypothetical protein